MPHYISAVLELVLASACLYYAILLYRRAHLLQAYGYAVISAAAAVGIFDMLGYESVHEAHDLLTAVSRFAGMLAIGIGTIAILLRYKIKSWTSTFFFLICSIAALVLYRSQKPVFEVFCLAVAVVFLLALLVLIVRLFMLRRIRAAVSGLIALLLFIFIAAFHQSVPEGYLLRSVDVVHICLTLAYTAVYYASVGYENSVD